MKRALGVATALLSLGNALAMAPAVAKTVPASRPAIAITIDDLPALSPWPEGTDRVGIAARIVKALHDARTGPVYGFVNHGVAEKDPAVAPFLDVWRQSGLPFGNHGWSHADLHKVGTAAFVEDITRDEPFLKMAMGGRDWHWFRYPFLNEGATATQRLEVRRELAVRGYRIAAVTMSFDDYLWNPPYARCVATADHQGVVALERLYLTAATDAARASRSQAMAVHGRDIPYVLLIHVGAFTTRMLPRLLAQYRHEGFRFVTLPVAEADRAYDADRDPSLPPAEPLAHRAEGMANVHRAADYASRLAAFCPTPATMVTAPPPL